MQGPQTLEKKRAQSRAISFGNLLFVVGDELQKRPIGITKVDRDAVAAGARPTDRSEFYGDGIHFEVVNGLLDRAGPFKAEVTATRWNRNFSQRNCLHAGTMQIQLGIFKSVSPTPAFRDEFNSANIAVEGVRLFPGRNVDHA